MSESDKKPQPFSQPAPASVGRLGEESLDSLERTEVPEDDFPLSLDKLSKDWDLIETKLRGLTSEIGFEQNTVKLKPAVVKRLLTLFSQLRLCLLDKLVAFSEQPSPQLAVEKPEPSPTESGRHWLVFYGIQGLIFLVLAILTGLVLTSNGREPARLDPDVEKLTRTMGEVKAKVDALPTSVAVPQDLVGKLVQQLLKDEATIAQAKLLVRPDQETFKGMIADLLKDESFQQKVIAEMTRIHNKTGDTLKDAQITEAVKKAVPTLLSNKEFADGLLKRQYEQFQKEAGEAAKIRAETDQKNLTKLLDAKIAEMRSGIAGPPDRQDVVVLATHSRRLPLDEYVKPFQRLFDNHPSDPKEGYHLGFYFAVQTELTKQVDPKDGKRTTGAFEIMPPSGNATETVADLGSLLLGELESQSTHPKRCVLVTSVRCEPPQPEEVGWKKFDSVDVILIRHNPDEPETASMNKWLDFCSRQANGRARGELILLPGKEKDQLYNHLVRLTRPRK